MGELKICPFYAMSYCQLPPPDEMTSSSTFDDYSIFNYSPTKMLNNHLQRGFQTSKWVNSKFSIHEKAMGMSWKNYDNLFIITINIM